MRSTFVGCALAALVVAGTHAGSSAPTVHLYADTAPNVFGSPAWAPWWASAKTDMAASAFSNMRSGAYPASLYMQPAEMIVYSTGDLGYRLHTLFWIPGETTASLNGRFQMRYCLDWGGVDYIYDFDIADYVAYDGVGGSVGWTQPVSSWENSGSGVAGRPGWAWWAVDDDALPYTTDGDPYNETNADDVEALARVIRSAQTYFRLEIRTRATITDPWGNYDSVQVNIMQPELSLLSKDTCVNAVETMTVDVRIDNDAEAWMAGVTTIVDFDDTKLAFVGATAVGPFPMVVNGPIVTGNTIRFSNGVGMGNPEVNPIGTVTVARLEFAPLAGSSGCSIADLVEFSSWGIFSSTITDDSGTEILHTQVGIQPVTIDLLAPTLVGVPGNVTTPCDAGETYATVPLTAPTATDNLVCGNPVVTLLVTFPDSSTDTVLPALDQYPIGTTTIAWTATDDCGNWSTANTTVTVTNTQVLNLDIQLSPSVLAVAHTRNVRVRWGAGALNTVVPVSFTGVNGSATVTISPAGSYSCISVKDELHTVTDWDVPTILLGEYYASAYLIQGDSNNDNKIDILDFGLFVGDFGPAAINGRSNFDADLFVNNADFTHISSAFFTVGVNCGGYVAGGGEPLDRISIRELRALGLGEMAQADINGDGWVDMTDVSLFMQGVHPAPAAPLTKAP